jgi:antitoxin (DNA-binding transcriptional repressor) of toxin-antitoxin stability system
MVMIKLNLHEVKTQFSKYIEMVEAGETIVVCKRNVPVAEIRSMGRKERQIPVLGSAVGKSKVPKSLFEPMTPRELRLWEEGDKNDPLRKYAPRPKQRRR